MSGEAIGSADRVRQVDVPSSVRALSTLTRIDYADTFLVDIGPRRAHRRTMRPRDSGRRSTGHPDPASVGVVVARTEGRQGLIESLRARLACAPEHAGLRPARRRLTHRDAGRADVQEGRRHAPFRHACAPRQHRRPCGLGGGRGGSRPNGAPHPRSGQPTAAARSQLGRGRWGGLGRWWRAGGRGACGPAGTPGGGAAFAFIGRCVRRSSASLPLTSCVCMACHSSRR